MSLLSVLAHREARRMLVLYAATVGLCAYLAWAAAGQSPLPIPAGLALVASALAALAGGLLLFNRIGALAQWERRLASLASGEPNALEIPIASGSSAADHGWNRLAEAGRRWQSLDELEKSIATQLGGCGGRSAPPLLDSLTDGVVTVDSAGAISYANSALAAMCGVETAEALLGRPLAEAFGAGGEAAAELNAPASRAEAVVEWSVPTGAGERILRGSRRPGRKSDGQRIAFVWTFRDVTQQRLAEAMHEKFLATATHEFRTPLANIRAYAESLDVGDDIDPESRKRFYNIIQSESLRLSQLVDDLLDISRMQAGALALDSRETDLGRLVEEVAAKVQGEMGEKNLEFRCELPPKFPKATVDKGKLAAALVNLLGNAAKYTPQGGRVTFRVDVSGEQVQFTVTDTGIGIAPEEVPHVFDRFYRSNDDRVREVTGSGLGLTLSHEVARLHGGDITVESTPNKGSSFRMTIPLQLAAVA